MSRAGFTGAVLAGLIMAAPAAAQQKAAPKAAPPPPATTCDPAPAPVKDITAERFYRDEKFSVADAMIVAKNQASLDPIDKPLRKIVRWSNAAFAKKDKGASDCALSWMAAWAQGEAMLGRMSATQAEYERKWRTAGMAVAYLKLKPAASAEQVAVIEPWLKALATKVEASDSPTKARNNHIYWIGLVSTAVGVATGDTARIAAGRRMFDAGMAAIASDGSLPEELKRGGLALHYHNYALAPLILSAELAATAGQDWYGGQTGPIHRLAAFTAAGNANRDQVKPLAGGITQKQPSGGILGWQAFYARRFPANAKGMSATGAYDYSWLGGDQAAMAAAWIR